MYPPPPPPVYIFEGDRARDSSCTPAVQQFWYIRQAKLLPDITSPKLWPAASAVWERSLPTFVPPTTANFSTSIALWANLSQEGSFGISQDLCVEEVARRSRGCVHPTSVCFCILVPASRITRTKDDNKLETLSSKYDFNLTRLCPALSRNCYFYYTDHLVHFLTASGGFSSRFRVLFSRRTDLTTFTSPSSKFRDAMSNIAWP
jgi:hypothetical protein